MLLSLFVLCKRPFVILLAGCALLCPGGVRANDDQKHFESAMQLYKEHKTEEALTELEAAAKEAPKDPTILRWIGFIHLERQEYDLARTPLETAAMLEPKSVVAHQNLGNVYDGLKLYPEALKEFRLVASLKPDSADAYYNIAMVHTKTGKWSDAVASLKTAIGIDSAAVAAPVKAGDPVRTEDPYLYDALGYALLNGGDAKSAVDSYEKAVKLAPDSAEFNFHLGVCLRRIADDKKATRAATLASALRALKTAAEHAPKNYEYVEYYGEILFDLNKNEEAIQQFVHALELDKTQYNAAYNLAVAYTRVNKAFDAEKAYAQAMTLVKPTEDKSMRHSALNGLTVALMKQQKYEDALTNLKVLTTEFPADTGAWVNLATAYRANGDDANYAEALKKAVANSAGYSSLPQLRTVLAAVLYRREDYSGALEQYTLANRALPNNVETLNGLALTEQKLRKFDEAIRDFQAAIKVNPRFADAYNNLGVVYETRYRTSKDKKDMDRAQTAYTQALAIDPNHALAKKNKERFDRKKS